MRLTLVFRTLAIVAFVLLVLVACLDPEALEAVRHRATHNALWLGLGLVAAALGAKLTLAIPVFGAKTHITAPLLLTLAAPYVLRTTVVRTGALKSLALLRQTVAAKSVLSEAAGPAHAADHPAALPARIMTALAAAARARRWRLASRSPTAASE